MSISSDVFGPQIQIRSIKTLVRDSRSYRRFDASYKIDTSILTSLVDTARFCPSAANKQPLKYYISNDIETNDKIFDTLLWAMALKDWDGPCVEERPTGYIIILGDNNIKNNVVWDDSIAAQTILLAATEQELGGCILGSINRSKLRQSLMIAENLQIKLVIALGKPVEEVKIEEDMCVEGVPAYWRDENQVHHVPKRSLSEVLINNDIL